MGARDGFARGMGARVVGIVGPAHREVCGREIAWAVAAHVARVATSYVHPDGEPAAAVPSRRQGRGAARFDLAPSTCASKGKQEMHTPHCLTHQVLTA